MPDVMSLTKMKAYVRQQKNMSDFELLDIRQIGNDRLTNSILHT